MEPRPVVLDLPFDGLWRVENSPASRVPSHGTHLLGSTYAIDFVGVDDRGRSATSTGWRAVLATEPPEAFVAFGRPVLAPLAGTVVAVHDGEPDHAARRSPLTLVPYALGQAARLRRGVGAVAGNHVVVARTEGDAVVAVVHLRAGSVRVAVGQRVRAGEQIAECGSSGNSTQPHLHLQAMDVADLAVARGVPVLFRAYRERVRGPAAPVLRREAVPPEGAVVERVAASP
ncbi:M23 family metallopeptidase [Cellulomonas sp. Marseille-Q8402]